MTKSGKTHRNKKASANRTHASKPPMREYECSQEEIAGWRSNPVRLRGPRASKCDHDRPTLLVQAMDGGFVTANCPECGSSKTLKEVEFKLLDLWVACPRCSKCMEPRVIAKNYVFACKNCAVYIKLSSLLPRAEDLL